MPLLPTSRILFPAKLITATLHPPPPNKNFLVRKWKMEDNEFSIFARDWKMKNGRLRPIFYLSFFTVDEKWKMGVYFPFFIFELR